MGGGSKQIVEEIEVELEENEITVESNKESIDEMTLNKLQEQSVNLEAVVEADFLDPNATREVQAKYEKVLSKLDNVVNQIEENSINMNHYKQYQRYERVVKLEVKNSGVKYKEKNRRWTL